MFERVFNRLGHVSVVEKIEEEEEESRVVSEEGERSRFFFLFVFDLR